VEHRLARRVVVVPAAAAFLTLVAGIGGFSLTRAYEGSQHRAAFIADAAPAFVELSAAFNRATEGTAQAPDGLSGDALASRFELEGRTVLAPGDTDPTAAVGIPANTSTKAAVRATLETARDTGLTRVTPPLPTSGSPVVLIVHPRYEPGLDAGTTAGRRTALQVWDVGVLRPATAAARVLGPLAGTGTFQLRDADAVLFRNGSAQNRTDAVQSRLMIGGRTWTLAAGSPSRCSPPPSPWPG
jgi:hypothetical protein